MKKDKLVVAAERLAKAYRAWIMANAAYNSLLTRDYPMLGANTYTIKWDRFPTDTRAVKE